jgi:N-sulfoglucosamine sulfohydrolase
VATKNPKARDSIFGEVRKNFQAFLADRKEGQPFFYSFNPTNTHRSCALIGREVHVGGAREGFMPYPVRALRTADFLYVRNFKPDRWPMGDPKRAAGEAIPDEKVLQDTRAAFADIDASPTKTWLIQNRFNDGIEIILRDAWEKRPEEELYILKDDPYQVRNVAGDPAHAATLEKLRGQLMAELEAKKDPRLTDAFDRPPYLDTSRE